MDAQWRPASLPHVDGDLAQQTAGTADAAQAWGHTHTRTNGEDYLNLTRHVATV